MSEWAELRLGDAIHIKHGYAFPGAGFGADSSTPQVLTPGNFALSGGFQRAKPKSFTGEYPSEFLLSSREMVVTMTDLSKTGDTLGYAAQLPEGQEYLHNQRIGRVELIDENRLDLHFFQYMTRTATYRAHVLSTASGSTVQHTSPDRIGRYLTVVPPLREQQAIAEVLGALDDKIAANTALAATNTALASAEFAAASRDVTRELTFDDVASVSGGGTPSTKITEFWDGNICWVTPTDMTALVGPYLESSSRMITRAGLEACSSKLFAPGAVLMTSRATIGALAINTVPTAVNQGFIVVEPRDPLMKWWLFHEMESRVDEFVSWANGATFLELSRGNFKRLQVRVPPGELLAKFVATATALHDAARALLAENRTLVATRDVLLPQLMSGKLRVRDAEVAVSDAGV